METLINNPWTAPVAAVVCLVCICGMAGVCVWMALRSHRRSPRGPERVFRP